MVWKSILGGVIGGIAGGPYGAILGASIGAGIEYDEDNLSSQFPSLNSQLEYFTDQDGYLLIITSSTLQEGNIVLIRALTDEGDFIGATSSDYIDDDGHFVIVGTYNSGCAKIYIPFGLVDASEKDKILISIRGLNTQDDNSPEIIGEDLYTIEWSNNNYIEVRIYRPLIGLCMAIARANKKLSRKDVRFVRELIIHDLGIPPNEISELKKLIKSEPSQPIHDMVQSQINRFPDVDYLIVLEILSDIVKSDNKINYSKIDAIDMIAQEFDFSGNDWDGIKEKLGLNFINEIDEYLKILDLHDNPTSSEIKQAFRLKIREYHPDRYRNLPDDIQKALHERSSEIIKAKDYLLNIYDN